MTEFMVLRSEEHAEWTEVLNRSFQSDFYHTAEYHALAEDMGEGRACLYAYLTGDYLIAVPLLLRRIDEAPCHAKAGRGWWDATSVYGYAGPIASHPDIPAWVLRGFQACLCEELARQRVVAVFTRLHPLIPQLAWLTDLGEYKPIGPTVSIDLTLPAQTQRSQYRSNHKRDLNKLSRLGVKGFRDEDFGFLNEFINTYYENMQRLNASDIYFFDYTYFEKLISMSNAKVHLFVCLLDGEVICGGLFFSHNGIVQYHLGGTRNEALRLSPMKILLDTVRLWANDQQAHVFHLGGGVGAKEDALFHFKAGFSDQRHEFAVWRWRVLPEVYDELCEEKAQWAAHHGLDAVSPEFFPAYRCPDCPCFEADSRLSQG
jgi:hypothetical protein